MDIDYRRRYSPYRLLKKFNRNYSEKGLKKRLKNQWISGWGYLYVTLKVFFEPPALQFFNCPIKNIGAKPATTEVMGINQWDQQC